MFRLLYALDPFSITENKEKALEIALKYFDRIYGTDTSRRDKIEVASYDYNDTHLYPEGNKNAFIYLLKGSPNRGVVILRDFERYFEATIDSLDGIAKVYVLKYSSNIQDFRSKAYRDYIIEGKMLFYRKNLAYRYNDYEVSIETYPNYSNVRFKPVKAEIRALEQWRPVDIERRGDELIFSIPTFTVPFALFDMLEESKEDLLAKLIRDIYGF